MSRSLGLVLGVVADALIGDPTRWHPVAGFGRWAGWVERRSYADAVAPGVGFVVAAVAPVWALGCAVEASSRRSPVARTVLTAAATWAVLGSRQLREAGDTMGALLADAEGTSANTSATNPLIEARAHLPRLCGRAAAELDAPELARATVESLAENANDAVVCSLFWGAVAGVPGLLVHRAVNTLDAMVGHRGPRYGRFGTAAARLDDALAWVPARLTGALACAVAPLASGDARRAWRTMVRDHARHPSPNGGWCEAAWAGAFGVRLGGRNVYGDRVEERGTLGEATWGRPDARTVRRAAALVGWVTLAATGLAALAARRSR